MRKKLFFIITLLLAAQTGQPVVADTVQAEPPKSNTRQATDENSDLRHLQGWMSVPAGMSADQQQQLQQIYRLMLASDYHAAEQQLAALYATTPAVLPLWVSLLTERQQFAQIRRLVSSGILAADHHSAVIAALFTHKTQPVVRFSEAAGTVALQNHWLVGLPRVKVTLNGHTFYFVLDTGASQSLITDRVTQAAQIPLATNARVTIDTATDNKVTAGLAILPPFVLGTARAENQPALVVDRAELEQRFLGLNWYQIDGILGWPLLKQLDLTFDFKEHILEVKQPVNGPRTGNLVWLFDDPMVITNRDEQPRLWFLDTGAGTSVLTADYLSAAQSRSIAWDAKEFGGLGGKGAMERTGQFGPVRIAFPSLAKHLEEMTVRADHQDCVHSRCDGRLGVDVAANHRMHINFQTATFDISKSL
jgi:predicted aspartyl protease